MFSCGPGRLLCYCSACLSQIISLRLESLRTGVPFLHGSRVAAAMHTARLLRTCSFVQLTSGSSVLIQPADICRAPRTGLPFMDVSSSAGSFYSCSCTMEPMSCMYMILKAPRNGLSFESVCTCRFVEPLRTGLPFLDGRIALKPGHLLEVVGPSGSAKSELLLQVSPTRSREAWRLAGLKTGIVAGESRSECKVQGGLYDGLMHKALGCVDTVGREFHAFLHGQLETGLLVAEPPPASGPGQCRFKAQRRRPPAAA